MKFLRLAIDEVVRDKLDLPDLVFPAAFGDSDNLKVRPVVLLVHFLQVLAE